ncbi:MAG TPA: hypothetical protein VL424_18460 [Pararobbsia sp.]|nr:hypothetical protein [Pararobbsia sp.]
MKRNHIILGGLFVSTALTLVLERNPSDPIVEAAPRTHAPGTPARAGSASAVVAIAALQARTTGDGAAGDRHRTAFGTTLLAPPVSAASAAGSDIPPLPTGTLAQEMPFTYIGKQSSDGRWEVFLSRGDETMIVREQTIIDGAYRVESIAPPTMTLVYLPTKLVQTLDIGSAD